MECSWRAWAGVGWAWPGPSPWNEEFSEPEVYVGKRPFLTLGGGVGSGLGVACFGSAFESKPEVLDSLLHVGVMAAVVSSACLSMYGPLFHEPPPLFTVVEIPLP